MSTKEASETALETKYMIRERRRHTVMLFENDDIDWNWDESEISQYCRMWKSGIQYDQIIDHFDRDLDELALLHLWLGRKKKIKPRKGGMT